MLLQLTHISYTYPGASDPALIDVTATFGSGWTGIVGDNGGGKTTLTLVAAGLIRPGELRKLMLAIGVQGEPEAIVMDEPTNHLDLGSVEALQRVLAGYPGALLLVTHDVSLVRATADVVWSIEPAGDGYALRVR